MIKNTSYFKQILDQVNKNKYIPTNQQTKIEKYYLAQKVLQKADNDVLFLGDSYDSLDKEEQDFVTNLFDKYKPISDFVLKDILLKEDLIKEKTFYSTKEKTKWLKEHSEVFKNKTNVKENLIYTGAGAGLPLIVTSFPLAAVLGSGASAIGLSILLGINAVGAGTGLSISLMNNHSMLKKLNVYTITEKGERFLQDEEVVDTETPSPVNDLEYLEI